MGDLRATVLDSLASSFHLIDTKLVPRFRLTVPVTCFTTAWYDLSDVAASSAPESAHAKSVTG